MGNPVRRKRDIYLIINDYNLRYTEIIFLFSFPAIVKLQRRRRAKALGIGDKIVSFFVLCEEH